LARTWAVVGLQSERGRKGGWCSDFWERYLYAFTTAITQIFITMHWWGNMQKWTTYFYYQNYKDVQCTNLDKSLLAGLIKAEATSITSTHPCTYMVCANKMQSLKWYCVSTEMDSHFSWRQWGQCAHSAGGRKSLEIDSISSSSSSATANYITISFLTNFKIKNSTMQLW